MKATTPEAFQFWRKGNPSPYYNFETGHELPAWRFGVVRIYGMDDTTRAWDFRLYRDPDTGERACRLVGPES
jgi:hypothetical protein